MRPQTFCLSSEVRNIIAPPHMKPGRSCTWWKATEATMRHIIHR